jgi:hypothetical protein
MARQRKTLPARRKNAIDTSLLIRSAESLGRVIGSLQRQLDAARQLTARFDTTPGGNGHAPVRKRTPGASLKPKKTTASTRRTTTKSSRSK